MRKNKYWAAGLLMMAGAIGCSRPTIKGCVGPCEEQPESVRVDTSKWPSLNLNSGESAELKQAAHDVAAKGGHVDVTTAGTQLHFRPDTSEVHLNGSRAQIAVPKEKPMNVSVSPEARRVLSQRTFER